MTIQPGVVKQSDLLNRLVLNRDSMDELGRLDVLWMYPPKHRVLGFICKSGFLGSQKVAFKLSQVDAIGENGILTHGEPEPTDSDRVSQLESLLHHEVWSDAGNKIGKITDCLFNLETGAITAYLFVSNGWAGVVGEIYQLPPNNIISFGRKRVLVPDTIADAFSVFREGIQHKLTKTSETLKEEAIQELRTIAKRTESATEQTKKRVQQLSDRTKERAQFLSQQAKEKVQLLNEQIKEKALIWTDQAKEKSQDWVVQVKEQTHSLSKQVEEGIQTLTVQAEEIFDSVTDEASTPTAKPPAKEPNSSPQTSSSGSPEDDDDEPWI
jgi:uncharacterized protein YrrD